MSPNFDNILKKQVETFNTKYEGRYAALFAAVRGSQNYGLETEYSDIDTLIVAMPTFKEMAFEKPLSKEVNTDVGICVLKDFRLFATEILKCNINYLEILYTPYIYIVSPKLGIKDFLKQMREITKDAPDRVLKSAMGQAMTHFAVYQSPHQSPHRLAGFIRCAEFVRLFIGTNYDFEKALRPEGLRKKQILDIKNNTYSKEHYTDNHVRFLRTDLTITYNIWKEGYGVFRSSQVSQYEAAFKNFLINSISLS